MGVEIVIDGAEMSVEIVLYFLVLGAVLDGVSGFIEFSKCEISLKNLEFGFNMKCFLVHLL